jgi:porphobilinogen synthase
VFVQGKNEQEKHMLLSRPRRNRKSPSIRALVQETRLHPSDLIYPQFVIDGHNISEEISTMPGICRNSLDHLLFETEKILSKGIVSIALFPVVDPKKKDPEGSEALNPEGLVPKTIDALKKRFPHLCVISDIALDPYTTHGHDGVLNDKEDVDNDKTVALLTKMALMHAQAGVDMVAPSDMMDKRVEAIRHTLDNNGFNQVSIHAYCAKYASSLYAPFREALRSAPRIGDKKSYQLNPANRREAILEAILDEKEGADILMIKPALFYLDVIAKLKEMTPLPISAFQVSGEYAMFCSAAQKGWINMDDALFESVLSIKRAGADMIFTYGAPHLASLIKEEFGF